MPVSTFDLKHLLGIQYYSYTLSFCLYVLQLDQAKLTQASIQESRHRDQTSFGSEMNNGCCTLLAKLVVLYLIPLVDTLIGFFILIEGVASNKGVSCSYFHNLFVFKFKYEMAETNVSQKFYLCLFTIQFNNGGFLVDKQT